MRGGIAAAFAVLAVPGPAVAARLQSSPQPLPAATPVATPSGAPPAAASPSASPFASPAFSASPASLPSSAPTASPPPLAVDRTKVEIVPGATAVVGVTGGSGAIVAGPSGPNVDVRYDAIARRLSLVGRAPGSATVALTDAAGATAVVNVLVAPPAGVVPSDVTVELGGNVSPQFAAAKIQAAIAASAQLRPGAQVTVADATPGTPLRPGDTLEAAGRVHIDGANAYVDTDGTTNVHLRVESLAKLDPGILFYSDDPEKLEAGTDGILYRGTLDPAKPARLYFYHVAYGSAHGLFLALRALGANARVEILGYAAGPTDAFAYVGHVSTLQYLLARNDQQSSVASVTADAPYLQQLGAGVLRNGQLVAGAFDLRVLAGGPVDVDVISTEPGVDPLTFLGRPELASDGHGRRGEFDLETVAPLALAYAAGSPDPAPFAIGAPTIANLRAGGRALGGDYGALRNVDLQLSNPGTAPATIYFYETPNGGSATTTIWFAGDPHPTELPCVVRPNRYTVSQYELAPGQSRTVTGEYMTDGASSFPLLFGLTSTPPSPPPGPYAPDACNPRTPPPAPSAAPLPSPSSTP